MKTNQPVIVIVGPTASGKSDLAMELAIALGGEIICADSRTVYKQMNVGTAKPSLDDQKAVRHHCLDLVEPDQKFSAAQFKAKASQAIKDIHCRDKIPLVVGGSGLYVDGLIYDFDFIAKFDVEKRRQLESMAITELQVEAEKIGISPEEISFQNPRHLARAIERGGVFNNRKLLSPNVLLLGIDIDKQTLDRRIENRIELMLAAGLEKEVRQLLTKYGQGAPGLLAPGYKALIEYINKATSFEEAKIRFISSDKKLAKRQKTWFKRNQDINWIKTYPEAEKVVADFLTKFDTISK